MTTNASATATSARLEHLNVTVNDPAKTAAMLVNLFGWHIRWEGPAIHNGYAIHVGTEQDYLAVYSKNADEDDGINTDDSYGQVNGLNHIGVVVEDLDATEQRVIAAGFLPNNHAAYEPGRRFYFDDHDGIEFEVASYNP